MELIPRAFFSPILCRLFNVIFFWGGDALGRKHQLLKDKGIIIIGIKSPLKEESQIERSFQYIVLCILSQKLEKKRSASNITLTLAHLREKRGLR